MAFNVDKDKEAHLLIAWTLAKPPPLVCTSLPSCPHAPGVPLH